MTRTCFILDELYPKDRGGIARLMHNIIHHAKSLDQSLDLHIVLARDPPKETVLQEAFQGVATLHFLSPDAKVAKRFGLEALGVTAVFPRQRDLALRELKLLDAVLACGPFDHIEIPDHMGLGSGILQAKRAGVGFQATEITCRIHSSLSIIIEAEPFYHLRNDWLAPRLEMERFALEHADRVVAHLPTIARFNQSHFNFPPSWLDKVETTFPPVIWPTPKAAPTPSTGKDFIFTSRFQPFKRPDLFIKAAITMLDAGSDYAGLFRMISYGFSPEYIDYLRLMVPARHRTRILIQTNISAEDRLEAIANSIIVQPSKYESLCALAYEASLAGRPLLLARDCLAFADDPHWKDEQNCLLFAPTPEGLATAMEQARTWHPSEPVGTTPGAPYFVKPPLKRPLKNPLANIALLSGPVRHPESAARVAKHVAGQNLTSKTANLFGYGAQNFALPNVAYHSFTEGGIAAQQWHDLAQNLTADAIVLHSPDALPLPAFLKEGARVVRPGVAYSSNCLDSSTGQMITYPGKFKTINLAEPRMCPPCIMLHKDDIFRLASNDDEDLLPRLITRLALSDIALAFSPVPHVLEQAPALLPPHQRHLAYEAGPLWEGGFRWVGMAVRPSQNTGLLRSRPISLIFKGNPVIECTAEQPAQFSIDAPKVFALETDHSLENGIFCLTVGNDSPKNKIKVSLQQGFGNDPDKTALENHQKGQNVRLLYGGQKYTMRWGPIWHAQPLLLVVTAQKPVNLHITNPILTTKA